jgi:hypothetical protein
VLVLGAAGALLVIGAIGGMYIQGPVVRAFFALSGLEPGGGALREPIAVSAPAPSGPCVDLNSATVDELDAIVHIGPARAAEIVRLRPFSSVDDMVRISGIGDARLRDIVAQGLVCP